MLKSVANKHSRLGYGLISIRW